MGKVKESQRLKTQIGQGQDLPSVQQVGLEALSLLIPILIYVLVLIYPIPAAVALNLRFDLFPGVLVFTLLLLFALPLKGYLGRTLSLSLTLLLFALPLAALWNTGISSGYTIGGLLPWTDANIYYWDARRLLQGELLYPHPHHQRPLATGLLATLLGLTQQNLQVTIALLVLIAAITSFFASRTLQRSHGPLAAAFLLIGLFTFYRAFSGSVMTETLGLALGCLGFTALWYGAGTRQIGFALAGLFLFSLGMNARVSAIFVLPAILLWGIWYFRHSQRFSWRFALSGVGVIFSAFFLNGGLKKLIAAPGVVPFSNFSYTLYGILTGGNWANILQTHPELEQLSSSGQVWRAYELSWQVFRENPLRLVMGILRGWQEFFWGSLSPFLVDMPKSWFDVWLGLLLLLGLLACWQQRKSFYGLLTLCLGLGVVLSIPLLPIWDAGLRPYATVMVIFYLLPALGLAFLVERVLAGCRRRGWQAVDGPWWQFAIPAGLDRGMASTRFAAYVPLGFGLLLTLGCTIAPVVIKATHHPLPPLANVCPPPLEARYYRINPGSSVNLVGNRSRETSHLPDVRIRDFRQGLQHLAAYTPERERLLQAVPAGRVLVDTFEYSFLVAKRSIVPQKPGDIVACGKMESAPALNLFQAESIQNLPP